MSIRVMSDVYDSDLTDIYEVSVMLALANHADDDGVCYPSTSRICELSRMKRRGVNGVIKRLQERGYPWCQPPLNIPDLNGSILA